MCINKIILCICYIVPYHKNQITKMYSKYLIWDLTFPSVVANVQQKEGKAEKERKKTILRCDIQFYQFVTKYILGNLLKI